MSIQSNRDRAYTPELRENMRVSVFADSFDAMVRGHHGRLQDLSISGCCVTLPKLRIQEESHIFVKLVYSEEPLKTIYSRVVWVKDAPEGVRVGLQFKHVSPDTLELLGKILEKYL